MVQLHCSQEVELFVHHEFADPGFLTIQCSVAMNTFLSALFEMFVFVWSWEESSQIIFPYLVPVSI